VNLVLKGGRGREGRIKKKKRRRRRSMFDASSL
jgi:hypothetical protein